MMYALGEQLLSLAQRLDDPDLLLEAHHTLWTSLFSGGELRAARTHQEQGMRLYDPHLLAVLPLAWYSTFTVFHFDRGFSQRLSTRNSDLVCSGFSLCSQSKGHAAETCPLLLCFVVAHVFPRPIRELWSHNL
jgi:hypothetical protein